ncbi:hypothetical protein BpHYR1_011236 [Brachionus plicatilis]|uniref:Uncharacterized protein n=1 Tax=Brachionus plicatilis TaxID=10195 RepID=A0A3M7SNV5_BRAPC|nr:hypothetical protein BpHYR1_011236 [Brachionus plicatilis]
MKLILNFDSFFAFTNSIYLVRLGKKTGKFQHVLVSIMGQKPKPGRKKRPELGMILNFSNAALIESEIQSFKCACLTL